MQENHLKIFKDLIGDYKIGLKINTIRRIERFSSLLEILKCRENTDVSFDYIYDLNEIYKEIITPNFDIEVTENDTSIEITGKEKILFDKEYGVIDSTLDLEILKFEKKHKNIIEKLTSSSIL